MLSYWEHTYFTHFDYIIIGSGITGLSTACSIKEQKPNATVLVLERGLLPTGASTKNAGFACIGSLSEKLSDLELMGEEALLNLIENRWKGLQRLRKRLGDASIDYQPTGGYEILFTGNKPQLEQIEVMNQLLYPIFSGEVFSVNDTLAAKVGFDTQQIETLICNAFDGELNTGKMMQSLLAYARSLQVQVITGADVKSVTELPSTVEVEVYSTANGTIKFYGEQVAYCTNAFTKQLLPNVDIEPGRGQVICTSPIPNSPIKGVFSFDEGYYYFRNINNRILFGGGRNLDFTTENTTEFSLNPTIVAQLETYLKELILPEQTYTIDYKWTGIMAFGKNKLPLLQRISERQVIGARLNGMGIALGSKIGDELCNMLLQ
jgi:glycine/D-amino acid oxidase-like deaminating enzyme